MTMKRFVSPFSRRKLGSIFRSSSKRHSAKDLEGRVAKEDDKLVVDRTEEEDETSVEITLGGKLEPQESETELTLNSTSTLSSSCISFDLKNSTESAVAAEAEAAAKPKKSVSFSDVTVRRYELIVGDNPYCRYPLALGWNFSQAPVVQVDSFEQHRSKRQDLARLDRIEPRLYIAPDQDKNPLQVLAADHYLGDVHMEQDFGDYKPHVPAELSLYERRARLRGYGYTEAELVRLERQRLVALALQWKDGGTPRFPFSQKFVTRYTR